MIEIVLSVKLQLIKEEEAFEIITIPIVMALKLLEVNTSSRVVS
jgi:hypothetical protein